MLATNEPTMNDISKEHKKLTIITEQWHWQRHWIDEDGVVAMVGWRCGGREGCGCGICGNSLPLFFVLLKNGLIGMFPMKNV